MSFDERKEIAMSTLQRISITALTAVVLGTVGASAGELPQYEVTGFPISPLQMSVLKSGDIQEQSPTPMLTLNGMPAPLHQIAVILGLCSVVWRSAPCFEGQITELARPHLENLGSTLLGVVPPCGFPAEQKSIVAQYQAQFDQRLTGALRDVEMRDYKARAGDARLPPANG
jgi:hypothetical protein